MRCKLPEKQTMKHRKGLWSPDEDQKLTYYVMNYGHACWSSVPINAGLERNGKSCRLRWINYLRPGLKRGAFSSQEEETILILHGFLGNKWSQISQHLPGRTDNEIKNYWHSHLKKKADKSKHLQVHQKHDYTHSNLENKGPSSLCQNAPNSTNTSSANMVQSVPTFTKIRNLPKLLFADWVSLDEFRHDVGRSSDQPLSHGSKHQSSTVEHEWQHSEGSTEGIENQNCLNMCSNDNMLQTQTTIDRFFEFNDVDFDIDNFLYMYM
ncbi:hypothetical protein E3N88_12733 [Mikania micrantha]|uniref:Uncharacterized protein n=1 Tax=Mikania micrantha TaxID=192012 RepID=A0A5N6P8E5_9ASTR|nr:hypothetical protein E3N88_12733 [Mikania micrantha]